MKKILCIILALVLFVGCSKNITPIEMLIDSFENASVEDIKYNFVRKTEDGIRGPDEYKTFSAVLNNDEQYFGTHETFVCCMDIYQDIYDDVKVQLVEILNSLKEKKAIDATPKTIVMYQYDVPNEDGNMFLQIYEQEDIFAVTQNGNKTFYNLSADEFNLFKDIYDRLMTKRDLVSHCFSSE